MTTEVRSVQLDLDADIVPGQGLGGLILRTHVNEIAELLTGLGVWREGSTELRPPFVARFSFGKGAIEIDVDIRNGKISQVLANEGYKGKLFDKITIGMSVREAMKLEPRLYYDEVEAIILCKDVPGLALDIPDEHYDAPAELVPDMIIASISVQAEEALTPKGQEGYW